MTSKLARLATGALTTGAMALALGGGSAAAENPAQHSTHSSCYSFAGYTYCYTDSVVYKTTVTPSGNEQYWAHIRSSYAETRPGGYNSSGESRYSYRYFFKDGVPMFYGETGKSSFSYPGETCTSKFVFRYVNGEYRVARSDYQCTPTT